MHIPIYIYVWGGMCACVYLRVCMNVCVPRCARVCARAFAYEKQTLRHRVM